jgi:RNA polymerase sigma-B factor
MGRPGMSYAATSTQRALLRALHERNDLAARDRLVEENLGLVRAIARRYAGRGEPLEDLVQVGTIGLIKAIDGFDPERGAELYRYAVQTIVGEIKRHFRDQSWAVHVPRRLKELNATLAILVDRLSGTLGRSPTIAELAQAASVSTEEVIEAFEAGQAYAATSLSAPVGDEPGTELGDILGGPEEAFAAVEDRQFLGRGLECLDERERQIVYLRFFNGMSQSQIAQHVGLSQMQVSRLIRRSLEKIGNELER